MLFARWGLTRCLCAVSLVAALASSASANIMLTGTMLTITATNGTGTGSQTLLLGDGNYDVDGNYLLTASDTLGLGFPILNGGGDTIAIIGDVILTADRIVGLGWHSMSLNWDVVAGETDTRFTITAGTYTFDYSISNPDGYASIASTITDQTFPTQNGVTLTGDGPGGKTLMTRYNGQAPGGTTFLDLLTGASYGSGSGGGVDNDGGGFMTIPGNVTSMSVYADFTLTAGDASSASSSYFITPEPATATLCCLAGLFALARKRS